MAARRFCSDAIWFAFFCSALNKAGFPCVEVEVEAMDGAGEFEEEERRRRRRVGRERGLIRGMLEGVERGIGGIEARVESVDSGSSGEGESEFRVVKEGGAGLPEVEVRGVERELEEVETGALRFEDFGGG